MADIIQLLPDSIANQIAAGEVVQRPASVVKELMENAVDAQSTSVQVVVKDGGKTLVQVIDNGRGMSETDARMSFERHATSKIREAADLFALRTMGFRGEALASIAAVAEVELRTRRPDDEVGTLLQINGSELAQQQPTACPAGANFCVKNLFFNIPARRKFLKNDSTELKHIVAEFQRVALANPQVEFRLQHNNVDLYSLPPGSTKQRIMALFGKSMNHNLMECRTQNSIVNVSGFVGKPECARKTPGEQFFFVNSRFMKSPPLHRSVLNAYAKLIPEGYNPPYFIYMEVDPAQIDVNIHPTKTEINFEDESAVWQIVHAAVRESIGRFSIPPTIEFERSVDFDIPHFPRSAPPPSTPSTSITKDYNPFEEERSHFMAPTQPSSTHSPQQIAIPSLIGTSPSASTGSISTAPDHLSPRFLQVRGKYIITTIASGLMLVDIRRAHIRILFEQFTGQSNAPIASQRELLPRTVELSPQQHVTLIEHLDELSALGLDLADMGHNAISVNSMPTALQHAEPSLLIDDLLLALGEEAPADIERSIRQRIALSLAKAAAVSGTKTMTHLEMQTLIDQLFACTQPNISPDGRPIVTTIELAELDRRLKK